MSQYDDSNVAMILPPGLTLSEAVDQGHLFEFYPIGYTFHGRRRYVHLAMTQNFFCEYLAGCQAEHINELMLSLFRAASEVELDWDQNTQVWVTVDCLSSDGEPQSAEVILTTCIEQGIKHWVVLMTPEECLGFLN